MQRLVLVQLELVRYRYALDLVGRERIGVRQALGCSDGGVEWLALVWYPGFAGCWRDERR
jgi:hypothetical protein